MVIVDRLLFSGGLVVLIGIFCMQPKELLCRRMALDNISLSHPWVHTKKRMQSNRSLSFVLHKRTQTNVSWRKSNMPATGSVRSLTFPKIQFRSARVKLAPRRLVQHQSCFHGKCSAIVWPERLHKFWVDVPRACTYCNTALYGCMYTIRRQNVRRRNPTWRAHSDTSRPSTSAEMINHKYFNPPADLVCFRPRPSQTTAVDLIPVDWVGMGRIRSVIRYHEIERVGYLEWTDVIQRLQDLVCGVQPKTGNRFRLRDTSWYVMTTMIKYGNTIACDHTCWWFDARSSLFALHWPLAYV